MIPIPTDKEKKACPKAATSVSPLIASGRISNRYLTPSQAFGKVTARSMIAISSRNKHGIKNLLNFSIPLETPRTTTKMHAPKNKAPHSRGCTGAEINCTKKSWNGAAVAGKCAPVKYTKTYFITQPPTIQ